MKRVSVIGTGYLGATHAACMAELGFDVVAVDSDAAKIRALASGQLPFHEPGLGPLIRRHVRSGRLQFTTDLSVAAATCDIHFICVGTPQRPDGPSADLRALIAAVDDLADTVCRPCLIVGKSTVPVGTAERLATRLVDRTGDHGVELAWNPEFLREGHAVEDSLAPDRLVFGVRSGSAERALRTVYAKAIGDGCPTLVTDLASAQLVKMAANSFLAMKISFINAVADLCEASGGDVLDVATALGLDPRIGAAGMRPGAGFGGGCLPKDVRAFAHHAESVTGSGVAALLRQVDEINLRTRNRIVELIDEMAEGLAGRTVTALGVAFKADSDDTRDSPALHIATVMHEAGAHVRVYDPAAMATARRSHPQLHYCDSVPDAVTSSDLLVFFTEWQELRNLRPAELAPLVRHRRLLDARHMLDPEPWRIAGWAYRALGRPRVGTDEAVAPVIPVDLLSRLHTA